MPRPRISKEPAKLIGGVARKHHPEKRLICSSPELGLRFKSWLALPQD